MLHALAYHANKSTALAWPTVETLAEESKMSARQVQRCLAALIELGLIEESSVVPKNVRADKRANTYRLVITEGDSKSEIDDSDPDDGVTNERDGVTNQHHGVTNERDGVTDESHGVTPVSPEHKENKQEPTGNTQERPAALSRLKTKPANRFAEWWSIFPKHKDRDAAQAAYDEVVDTGLVDEDTLIAAADRYRDDPDRRAAGIRFTTRADKWLRDEAWRDYAPGGRETDTLADIRAQALREVA
ncbi:helix-turn-helix domain-containing protein [Nocardia sp. CA-135953]|uniref:helix-turn-helix domain-containing protein n=1 Tax=Nocardia sp. CA-135953 TaxID=3239978 RepID=UPI003D9855AD